MRANAALIALLATSGPALAGNPYTAAGITNPVHVTQFVARLKRAAAADDRAAVSAVAERWCDGTVAERYFAV